MTLFFLQYIDYKVYYFNFQHPEEEEAEEISKRSAGAAIAPPPSLTVDVPAVTPPSPATPPRGFSLGGYGSSSVAAKIMAKYGFKVIC